MRKAEGLYQAIVDGEWGPLTDAACQAFEARALQIQARFRTFDLRSERNILSLSLRAQVAARRFLGRVRDGGLDARIISGTRTYAEQDALYRQGRNGNPGKIVTNARGGHSNHNFGIAWDIGVFRANGTYIEDGPEYKAAADLGRDPEIEWGGDWIHFVDKPHYQLNLGMDVAQLRTAFEQGSAGPILA
jgi:peptidoglycan L-alanyl-D-glutamate endopeptidase CwlK